jgi:hypothetical protein
MSRKGSILDSVAVLALIGILAGAIGGLGIGVMTSKSGSSATTSTSAH